VLPRDLILEVNEAKVQESDLLRAAQPLRETWRTISTSLIFPVAGL